MMSLQASVFSMSREAGYYAHAVVRNLFGRGLETIRDGSGAHFRWVDTKKVLDARDFPAVMEAWGFTLATNDIGDYIGIRFLTPVMKLGDEEILLKAIAPYVDEGSYITVKGEDDARWRWHFQRGTLVTEEISVPPASRE